MIMILQMMYMMMFLNDNLDIRHKIYIEMYDLYNKGLNDEKLSMLMDKINDFMLE